MAETTLAFLMTDVVGSSALAESDPAEYLRRLAEHDRMAIEMLSAGTIVKSRGEGDSVFATFPTVDAAAGAARAFGAAVVEEGLSLRCAIHIGPVTLLGDGGDFRGDTVNRCARLRALAEPGEVLLTRAAVEMLVAHEVEPRGTHAVRGLTRPIEAHRLVGTGSGERLISSTLGNLPRPSGVFFGRGRIRELAVAALNARRLCALVGPEGIGKTRLAIEIAREIDARDGAWFVDLSASEEYEAAIRDAMRIVATDSSLAQSISARRGHCTLILDDPRDPGLAARIGESIARDSHARVLLTTTEEPEPGGSSRAWTVLTVGALDSSDEGVSFLREIAGQFGFEPGDSFEDLRTLCEELGGSPLAIELAAPRLRLQSARRLGVKLARAGGASGPEAGILRMVAETYDRLDEEERRLLRLLAVFPGGFATDHCENFGLQAEAVFERLVTKSAALPDHRDETPRFQLPRPLRRLAIEARAEGEEDEAIDGFVRWAVQASEEGAREGQPWNLISAEMVNLEAAFDDAYKIGRFADVATIARALRKLYLARARASAGLRRYDAILNSMAQLSPSDQADAWNALGIFRWMTSDYPGARLACNTAVTMYEAQGLTERAKFIRLNCAIIQLDSGDLARAEAGFRECATGGGVRESMHLADALWRQGKFEEGDSVAARVEREALSNGDTDEVEALRINRAAALISHGRDQDGESEFLRTRAEGSPLNAIYALLLAARIARRRGEWRLTLRCLNARSRVMDEAGHRDAPFERKIFEEINNAAPIREVELLARESGPMWMDFGPVVAELLAEARRLIQDSPSEGIGTFDPSDATRV